MFHTHTDTQTDRRTDGSIVGQIESVGPLSSPQGTPPRGVSYLTGR